MGVFPANIDLLRQFLAHRDAIATNIAVVLDAQQKPPRYLQDQSRLSRRFEECFASAASPNRLRRQLEAAHWTAGFRPRQVQGLYNDLIHPVEMMIRGFYCWQQTQWPDRNGRLHYAHTLFNVSVLRSLEFLSMRLWDDDPDSAGARLAEMQAVLDGLWSSSPAGQPAIVRDTRWLIPLAQSQITDALEPYFDVAQRVSDTLPEADILETNKASVRMLGGHLTSQIRYYCMQDGVSIHAQSVVLRTRNSNALDFALLVQGLVPLLAAYEHAVERGHAPMRLHMAGAIWQGISADPELFLNRLDLMGAYTMIEHVFISGSAYSPHGQRHVQLLQEYAALIHRLLPSLRDDLPHFRPADGTCSPYGVIFGLPSNLLENMTLKALQPDAEARFSLEDVFDDGDPNGAKLAWVNGWRHLPHIAPEVQREFDYPHPFAEAIYTRIESQLNRGEAPTTGRLYIGDEPAVIPKLRAQYFASSDKQVIAANQAEPQEQAQLLAGRQEGHFLVSYETPGGWVAVKKDLLTKVLGAGRDARIAGLPPDAVQVLRLMCAGLVPENVAG